MKHMGKQRFLALILSLVLVIEVFPMGAFAANLGSADFESVSDSASVETELKSPIVLGEVEELRTEDEKQFQMSDGSYMAVSYGMPIHYQHEDGKWADIDNTLQPVGTYSGHTMYTATNGNTVLSFTADLSDGQLFTTAYGEQSVSVSLLDAAQMASMESTENTTPPFEEITGEVSDAESMETDATEQETPTEETTTASMPVEPTEETEAVPSSEPGAEETVLSESGMETQPVEANEFDAATEATVLVTTEVPETADSANMENLPIETEPVVTDSSTADSSEVGEPKNSAPAEATASQVVTEFVSYNHSAVAQLVPAESMALAAETGEQPDLVDAIIPEKLNSAVLYEDVFPGVDLLYNVTGYNIKESILVKSQLDCYRFSFQLNLDGLTPKLQENGSITLEDSAGTAVYMIPAPYLFDAANHASDAANYLLSGSETEGYILTVEADPAWMNSADRVYPITIDPTLFLVAGNAADEIYATYVEEGNPTADHGHYQDLYFGYTTYQNTKERQIYMHFNKLPTLPVGSVVVYSSLNLWQFDYTHVGCSEMGIGLYEVTGSKSSKYDNYHDWIYYLDWNTKPAFDAANMIDYVTASKAVDDSYLGWEITELVNKWYEEGTENRTVALAATERGSFSGTHCAVPIFYAYGGSHPPILMVSYRNSTGIEPYYTYQSMGAGHAGTAYISDFSSQLTVAKELFTFASTTNPFSVQLVFNSAYFSKSAASQYDLGPDLGMEMHFGSGCTYNFIQHVKEETIDGTTYIRYLDGDGTIHYFVKDAEKDAEIQKETGSDTLIEYYYDEDGLGLKINEYLPGFYSMTDDNGNEWVFVHGPLLWVKDSDGNKILIHYSKNGTATSNDYPTGTKDRIEKITQKNVGGSETTIATFSYKSHAPKGTAVSNYIETITDYAGNKYAFDYEHGKLISIKYNGSPIAQYTMTRSNNWLQNELAAMTDVETGYTLKFTYKNHKVSAVEESVNGSTGTRLEISHTDDRRTMYRDIGKDRASNTSDDILTYYGFDYAGRTVNAYTTDSAGNILGASNAAYSGNGSTDRTNNRTMRTAAIGVTAQQELRNFGFESTASDVAWQTYKTSSDSTAVVNAVINTDKPRTGAKSFKTWITPGKVGLTGTSKASNLLQANMTYILSAYVNTSQAQAFAGKGVYLQVKDTSGNTWKSPCVNYKTSSLVDDGWVRLSLTFKTKVKCNHTVSIYNDGVGGVTFADDVQLE